MNGRNEMQIWTGNDVRPAQVAAVQAELSVAGRGGEPYSLSAEDSKALMDAQRRVNAWREAIGLGSLVLRDVQVVRLPDDQAAGA